MNILSNNYDLNYIKMKFSKEIFQRFLIFLVSFQYHSYISSHKHFLGFQTKCKIRLSKICFGVEFKKLIILHFSFSKRSKKLMQVISQNIKMFVKSLPVCPTACICDISASWHIFIRDNLLTLLLYSPSYKVSGP